MTTIAAWAAARADVYRFLAAAFVRPPAPELVAPFLDHDVLSGLEVHLGHDAVSDLTAFRERFRGDYDALDCEYQQLFVVPLGRYVTPYEAVYRDERVVGDQVVRGLLVGPSTVAIRQLYRDAGLDLADDVLELPDHVGIELGCMERLCRDEARAWNAGDDDAAGRARELERRLLVEHLLAWVPSLCARIRENATDAFYRGVAALTEAFLRQEQDEVTAARVA